MYKNSDNFKQIGQGLKELINLKHLNLDLDSNILEEIEENYKLIGDSLKNLPH